MGLFRCKHKYGEIKEDGYQYCQKCGLATKPICQHKWKKIENMPMYEGRQGSAVLGYLIVQECEICGELKNFKYK